MALQSPKELPYQGEFFFSKNKKHSALIFFVHYYEGDKRKLLRHIRLVNQLGYDAFAFNLVGTFHDISNFKLPFGNKGKYGLKHFYAKQITILLDLIPGKKIVYSFSNPSAAAIEAISERQAKDIEALICDSGPALDFITTALNLYTFDLKARFSPWQKIISPFLIFSWSLFNHRDIKGQLQKIPPGFPILSIQGGADKLIHPKNIKKVFAQVPDLNLETNLIPAAEHLRGLKDFPGLYEPPLREFLKKVST